MSINRNINEKAQLKRRVYLIAQSILRSSVSPVFESCVDKVSAAYNLALTASDEFIEKYNKEKFHT